MFMFIAGAFAGALAAVAIIAPRLLQLERDGVGDADDYKAGGSD